MKIIYLRTAIKDVRKIKSRKRKEALRKTILALKKTDSIKLIASVQKLAGHSSTHI